MAPEIARRRLLQLLAASPLWSAEDTVPTDPSQALNVFDFELAAQKALPPAHYGYIKTGVDGDQTLRANETAIKQYQIRPRRLIDVSKTDLSVDLFGTKWNTPIVISPCGSQRAFHPEGEIAVARASASRKTLQVLSTVTTASVEEVAAVAAKPLWYQLYLTSKWELTEKLVRRADAAGCPVLVVTVDLPAGRNTETEARYKRMDTRDCSACHGKPPVQPPRRKPMLKDFDLTGVTLYSATFTWRDIDKLRKITKMKIVLKGIATAEDGELCRKYGIDGIVVSNHGGRAEESRPSIDCLAEVVDAAGSGIPVLVDGGFRRGTDIFKALALGARAVGIGRPYLWGLSAFGQPGVEAVLDMLRKELNLIMRQAGTPSIRDINRRHVIRPVTA